MNEKLKLIKEQFPDAIRENNGNEVVDYELLSLLLADEVCDLQDELNEKDYQILHIMEQLDEIKSKIM